MGFSNLQLWFVWLFLLDRPHPCWCNIHTHMVFLCCWSLTLMGLYNFYSPCFFCGLGHFFCHPSLSDIWVKWPWSSHSTHSRVFLRGCRVVTFLSMTLGNNLCFLWWFWVIDPMYTSGENWSSSTPILDWYKILASFHLALVKHLSFWGWAFW